LDQSAGSDGGVQRNAPGGVNIIQMASYIHPRTRRRWNKDPAVEAGIIK